MTFGFAKFLAVVAMAAGITSGCQAQPNDDVIAPLQRLATAGNAEAIYYLGMAYQTGTGLAEDHAKALDAFRRSAALGDPLGAYKLGCYFAGQGEGLVASDEDQALRYKLVAAEAGYALAQQDVAAIYGRRGDPAKALSWAEKSAAQGWSGGLMALASAYNGTPGIDRDPAKTAAYFRLVIDRSDASDAQREWLTSFEAKMSAEDRARAAIMIRDYKARPSPLTIKGLSGHRAAIALVERTR